MTKKNKQEIQYITLFKRRVTLRSSQSEYKTKTVPKLERVLVRSIKAFFPGLLSMERLAREMSAVTRVIVILRERNNNNSLLIYRGRGGGGGAQFTTEPT